MPIESDQQNSSHILSFDTYDCVLIDNVAFNCRRVNYIRAIIVKYTKLFLWQRFDAIVLINGFDGISHISDQNTKKKGKKMRKFNVNQMPFLIDKMSMRFMFIVQQTQTITSTFQI